MSAGTVPRRELLLTAAAELFRRRGFHAVGVDDIAEAAGITGPGLYRHFANKEALLVALFDRAGQALVERARQRVAEAADAEEAFEALCLAHLEMAVTDRSLLSVYLLEIRSLPHGQRQRLAETRHAYYALWEEVASQLRPDLRAGTVAAVVRGVLAMLTTAGEGGDGLEPTSRLFAPMARQALEAAR